MKNARAFLGKEGFLFDKKPNQIDKLFLREFSPDEAIRIRAIWAGIHAHNLQSTALYSLPKTEKQANILWSYDRSRYVATFEWLLAEIEHWRPTSIVDMGCGSGTFLKFVRANYPHLTLKGIEYEQSLASIARCASQLDVDASDYLSGGQIDRRYDAIVCNFGFDLARFSPSTTPHSIQEIGGSRFCPGCSNDFADQFDEYFKCWGAWVSEDAKIFLTGRLPNFGFVRGVIIAAAKNGWGNNLIGHFI